MAFGIVTPVWFGLVEKMFGVQCAATLDEQSREGDRQLDGFWILRHPLAKSLFGAVGGFLCFVKIRKIDIGLGIVRPNVDGGLETFFCCTLFSVEQLGESEIGVSQRVVRCEINGLLQFIFCGDVLHLLKRDLTEQTVCAGILGVDSEYGFGLIMGIGILRRRNLQSSEVQAGI